VGGSEKSRLFDEPLPKTVEGVFIVTVAVQLTLDGCQVHIVQRSIVVDVTII